MCHSSIFAPSSSALNCSQVIRVPDQNVTIPYANSDVRPPETSTPD